MLPVAPLALEHLLLRLRPLNRALRAAVDRQTQLAARLIRPDVTPLCITENQVHTLLDDADALLSTDRVLGESAVLTSQEASTHEELRQRSGMAGYTLPLDQLAQTCGLSPFEQEAVLLCIAPEMDRSYERIYAYILDDLNRRAPCVELLSALTAGSLAERVSRRHALSRFGRLRRTGLLQAYGDPATELRQELRVAPGLFDFLTGTTADPTLLFQDREEVHIPDAVDLPPEVDREKIARFAQAIKQRTVTLVGVWGPRHSGQREVTLAIAATAHHPLRRWSPPLASQHPAEQGQHLRQAIHLASALGAILWIPTDRLSDQGAEHLCLVLTDQLAASQVPVILSGVTPWRPASLLEVRRYAELELEAPSYLARRSMWEQALPEVSQHQLSDLAARFRIGGAEVQAVAQLARTQAQIAGNGHPAPISDQLNRACVTITRQQSAHFATVVTPKRGPDDLILPPSLHQQVLEVAQFFRAWPQVAEGWGFGRLTTGEGGIKALFTGDSGTGKTLAAEVIAGLLKMPLLKVDLARVVSKWVGETEKHLEAAFHEAEESHSVLFFDEADALFGKRGEVQHGTDRYANLEVSYLLQRLEDHYGLVILASNLKDNIDAAFTRRFQIVIHFPRPESAERRRMWEMTFPKSAPLEDRDDLDVLAKLDLTGAGIVGAARTAALLALSEGSTTISRSHIVNAIQRQYQREARVLMPGELGPYSELLRT